MTFKTIPLKIIAGMVIALLFNSVQATQFNEHPGVNQMGHIEKMERLPGGSFLWLKANGKDYLVSENGRIAIIGDFKIMDVWSKTQVSRIEDACDKSPIRTKAMEASADSATVIHVESDLHRTPGGFTNLE